MDFADLLRQHGIAPEEVALLRHTPTGVKVPLAAWRDHREEFESYQTYQEHRRRKLFRRPIWASFVGIPDAKALFVGLYSASPIGPVPPGTINPLRGNLLDPTTHTIYKCERLSVLDTYSERLIVNWGGSTSGWAQSGERPKTYEVLEAPFAIEGGARRGLRPPPWLRDELILALELYLATRNEALSHSAPKIAKLSEMLNALGEALGRTSTEMYRNPNGVYMKLMNFRRLDPGVQASGRSGLTRGNALEGEVWAEFADDPSRLAEVASAIRSSITFAGGLRSGEDELTVEGVEGLLLTRVHLHRERNRALVHKVKANALKRLGRLACQGCGFDFEAAYGSRGRGFIECHHLRPVATLAKDGEKVSGDDLALVCSNCHRMIHAKRPWLRLDELRDVLGSQKRLRSQRE